MNMKTNVLDAYEMSNGWSPKSTPPVCRWDERMPDGRTWRSEEGNSVADQKLTFALRRRGLDTASLSPVLDLPLVGAGHAAPVVAPVPVAQISIASGALAAARRMSDGLGAARAVARRLERERLGRGDSTTGNSFDAS